jgi:glycerol-3-phosphate O-acyltransferase
MFRTVAVPLWLLILILGFAAVTFASHFLFPSVRWYLRRRMEKVVARLNQRLTRPIEPFKLARRYDTIQRLIYDPRVIEAVADQAHLEGIPESVAFQQAQSYAREIVPRFSASAYFGLGTRLARALSNLLYRVRLTRSAEEELAEIPNDAAVIYVMNHRSNMDYVLVTFLAANRSALSYAAGEWAMVWPMSALIRSMGAYFIRRKSRNALYRRVLARYVQIATAAGLTQAVYPEGGLSLDASVGAPRLGILSYILTGFDPEGPRDVIFVPVAINYDRVLEDRFLIAAHKAGTRKFPVRLTAVALHVLRVLWKKARGSFEKFGYAAVSFGTPISLRAFRRERPAAGAEAIGDAVMEAIRRIVPALPVPILAHVVLQGPGGKDEIASAFAATVDRLTALGAIVHLPEGRLDRAFEDGLAHLLARRLISVTDGLVAVVDPERDVLAYYANSIAHLFSAGAPAA